MRRPQIAAVSLILLCGVLYANSLGGAFQLDDATSIVENRAVHQLDPQLWWEFWPGRIVAYASFAINYQLHGLGVAGYHVTNVVVHAGATLAAYALVLLLVGLTDRTRDRYAIAFTAAALFAAHPLQTQAVSYIVQRTAALCDAFYLGAVAAYLWSLRRRRHHESAAAPVALSLTLGVLAALTKELAASLPLAILLADFTVGGAAGSRTRRVLPYLAVGILPVAIALMGGQQFGVVGGSVLSETENTTRSTYLLTQIDVVARYLRLVVFPIGQNVDHHVLWRYQLFDGMLPLLLLLHSGLIAGAIVMWRRGWRLWSFCVGWFYVTLAPESSLFPIRDAMFEHRVYLAMLGPALAVGLAFERAAARWRTPATVALVILLAGLGTLTVARNRVWASPLTLWSDSVTKSPNKSRPHMALGGALGQAERWQEARRELEIAVRLRPNNAKAWTNLGNVQARTGDRAAAVVSYRRAIEVDPEHVSAWYNLGVALDRAARMSEAEAAYREALRLEPHHGGALNALAAVLLRGGRPEEAWTLAQRAQSLGYGAPRLMTAIDNARRNREP